MLSTLTIEQVLRSQISRLELLDTGMPRYLGEYNALNTHALIISGIRRCGKSTYLHQLVKNGNENFIYLNFEDPRLVGFDLTDFNRLHELAVKQGTNVYYFDEIQNVSNWENFVRFRLDEGYKITITGSNASMLSRELGTKLTGRHITREMFPFSYREFLQFSNVKGDFAAFEEYLLKGGFPEYLKTGLPEVLMHVFNDIVIRDIALRHSLKNTMVLQQLAVFLISNIGKLITGNSLRKIFPIGSSSSVMEYLSHFADAYLFFFVPVFSYSQKVQLVNPRKVYCIDNGLTQVNSVSFSGDKGRMFENMVFLHLRRQTPDIFYFSQKRECDFVVLAKGNPSAFQVCWQLDESNLDREINGLTECLDFFGLKSGIILTANQTDHFETNGKTIEVKPFYKWVSEG